MRWANAILFELSHLAHDVKDKFLLDGIAERIIDYYIGNKVGFISVSNHYENLMMVADMKTQAEENKSAPISSKIVIDYLELDD